MKLTIDIKDKKASAFLQFLKTLDFVSVQKNDEELFVPEWHKQLIRARVRSSKAENYFPWKEAKKQLKHKK